MLEARVVSARSTEICFAEVRLAKIRADEMGLREGRAHGPGGDEGRGLALGPLEERAAPGGAIDGPAPETRRGGGRGRGGLLGGSACPSGGKIGEWVGAQQGLGFLMIQSNARLQVDLVFAAILLLTAMGLAMWWLVGFLERKIITWK